MDFHATFEPLRSISRRMCQILRVDRMSELIRLTKLQSSIW